MLQREARVNPGPECSAGFTLVELVIALLIIGILILVALPAYLGARARAQDRAAQALLRDAVTAVMLRGVERGLNGYADLGMTAVAGQDGCPDPLPSPKPGGSSVNAMCAEPGIAWSGYTMTLATPPGIVGFVNLYPRLCLKTISANGPTWWYAEEGATTLTPGGSIYTVVGASSVRISTTAC